MNIFYLDRDPKIAAQMHCDKHVCKMILESVQMLQVAQGIKEGYKNHPCTKWVKESHENYMWLYKLLANLCLEYTYRYGRLHKYFYKLFSLVYPPSTLPDKEFTDPPQCMPDKYKCEDTVKAYRDYYIGEKSKFAKWSKRAKPNWYRVRVK